MSSNRLAAETSPYLLQHAENPVDWYPWGEEALARAREEQKPILVSIGYAACHWCHVMERESFEDPEVGEPGRLVSVGRGGARPRARGAEADPGLDRLRRLPLVPRDGARVVRGSRGRGA